jgi:hypothetical protein
MFKICIVEIKGGNHSVAALCKYANPAKNEVLLFTTSRLLPNIEHDLGDYSKLVKITVKENEQSFFSFIKKINQTCNEGVNLLILNTVSRWEFLFLNPGCPTFAYFYSLKFWFQDVSSPWTLFRKWFKINYLNTLSWLPNRWHANPFFGPIIRKGILVKIHGVFIEYPPFVNLLTEAFDCRKPVFFLPKRVYEGEESNPVNKKTVFVIPGMISNLRRDYSIVLDALQELPRESLSNMKLILLGKPIGKYGLTILQRLNELNQLGLETKCFVQYISHEVFSETLSGSDVIIAPIKFDYHSGVISEKFTYTKGTGTFPDMIRYAKPTIVPSEYNIAEEFRNCFIAYDNPTELGQLLVELSANKDTLFKVRESTISTLEKYSLGFAQDVLWGILSNLE